MIREISALDWLRLIAAFLVFLGPGFALLSFLPIRFYPRLKRFSSLAVSFSGSVVFWALLFLWLKLVRLPLSAPAAFVICGAGWAVVIARLILRQRSPAVHDTPEEDLLPPVSADQPAPAFFSSPVFFHLLEAATAVLYIVVYVMVIGKMVAGLGSDSYHHTLIAQMFSDQGQIPDNYLPYAPILSFSYHYGFHSFIAVLGWLSNWPVRLLVLASGPLMVALSGLAVAFLLSVFCKNRLAEWIALVVVTFLSVFPAFMLNWGRYSQTLGMILALCFLSLFILWHQDQYRGWGILWIAALAIGVSLAHYRVTIMCAVGVFCFLVVELLLSPEFRRHLRQNLVHWAAAVLAAIFLVAPWLYFVYTGHQQGVRILYSVPADSSFFSLERLGAPVLGFPTNNLLLLASLVAIVWGGMKRDRLVIWITGWWAALFILSDPRILWGYMDRVSYYIAVYVPFGLLVGWLVVQVLRVMQNRAIVKYGLALVGVVLVGWGTQLVRQSTFPDIAGVVQKSDLSAMQWIRANVPQDALFMVNTYAFSFASSYIIGLDAGYWIPALAERKTVIPPMNYQAERFENPDMINNLVRLHGLNGHLADPEATAFLRQIGVDYVYVGNVHLLIQVQELLESSEYHLAYQEDDHYVFELLPPK